MDISVKKRILLTFYSHEQWSFDSLDCNLEWDASNSTAKPSEDKFIELAKVLTLNDAKATKIDLLNSDFNSSKQITIQNGKTLVITHNTPERGEFIKLMENVSTLSSTTGTAFIYKQDTDAGCIGLRILPEIAEYIFKDLFIVELKNGTKVNSRVHNKTTVYEFAVETINKATTQAELDSMTWSLLNPQGIVIDVNDKAIEMLADTTVSDFAKATINAAKDPVTNEIHLVKTLSELAADS